MIRVPIPGVLQTEQGSVEHGNQVNRCHRDACFPGYCVSRTHIPRDACFPAHISLTHLCLQVIVIYVSQGILFPRLCCEVAIAMAELVLELA